MKKYDDCPNCGQNDKGGDVYECRDCGYTGCHRICYQKTNHKCPNCGASSSKKKRLGPIKK
jgi:predicted RNA-binding Zn-ribbon protein involved in translation (DUF1610 family)